MHRPTSSQSARAILALSLLAWAIPGVPALAQEVAIQGLTDHVVVMHLPLVGIVNSVVISSQNGLVIVDTGPSPMMAARLKAAAEEHFGTRDWAYVINTHGHGHASGNLAFGGVPVVGHDNLGGELESTLVARMADEKERAKAASFPRTKREELVADTARPEQKQRDAQIAFWRAAEKETLQGFDIVLPTLTLSQELTLHLGNRTVKVAWVGKGHSTADVVVYVPDDRVLVTGGACPPVFPKVKDRSELHDLRRWIAVFDSILGQGVDYLVAAHAEPTGPDVAVLTRNYYRDLLAILSKAQAQDLPLAQARTAVTLGERFPDLQDLAAYGGTQEQLHAANVAAVWKLLSED